MNNCTNENLITENKALKKHIQDLNKALESEIKYRDLEIERLRKIVLRGCELDNFINKRG